MSVWYAPLAERLINLRVEIIPKVGGVGIVWRDAIGYRHPEQITVGDHVEDDFAFGKEDEALAELSQILDIVDRVREVSE